jgi:hypothetical protein
VNFSPVRVDATHIEIPVTLSGDDGLIGDGSVIIDTGDPRYAENDRWITDNDQARAAFYAAEGQPLP